MSFHRPAECSRARRPPATRLWRSPSRFDLLGEGSEVSLDRHAGYLWLAQPRARDLRVPMGVLRSVLQTVQQLSVSPSLRLHSPVFPAHPQRAKRCVYEAFQSAFPSAFLARIAPNQKGWAISALLVVDLTSRDLLLEGLLGEGNCVGFVHVAALVPRLRELSLIQGSTKAADGVIDGQAIGRPEFNTERLPQ